MAGLLRKPARSEHDMAGASPMPADMGAAPGQMPSQGMPPQGMPGPPQTMAAQPAEPAMGADSGAEPDLNDPAYLEAKEFAKKALYEKTASDNINKALKMTDNPVQQVADIAYNIAEVVDEKTQGRVPEDLLLVLGMEMLGEVVDIAQASGVQMGPVEIFEAEKNMILRFAGEAGLDTRELEAAMNQITPEQINQIVNELQGQMGAQDAPVPAQPPVQPSAPLPQEGLLR